MSMNQHKAYSIGPSFRVRVGEPRQRKKHHAKVVTGCQTCKLRRIKCDESRPWCLRCKKGGFQCPGYQKRAMLLFEPRTGPQFASDTERLSFDFLREEGSRMLSVFQGNTLVFWTRLAPQLTTHSKAVYHAFVALGSLQRPMQAATSDRLRDVPAPEKNVCALYHLDHAFREFAQASRRLTSLEVFLSCSILFLALQIWIEQTASVSLHTMAAARLLLADDPRVFSRDSDQVKPCEGRETWIAIIGNMVNHAAAYADDFCPASLNIDPVWTILAEVNRATRDDLSTEWKQLQTLDLLLKAAIWARDTSTSPIKLGAVFTLCTRLGQVLYAPYGESYHFLLDKYDFSAGRRHLLVHHRVLRLMLKMLGHPNDRKEQLTALASDFDFIVSQSQISVAHRRSTLHTQDSSLHPTLGLLPPLFFAALECEEPRTRQRALALLHKTSVCERDWTSCIAWNIACHVIDSGAELGQAAVSTIPPVAAAAGLTMEEIMRDRHTGEMRLRHEVVRPGNELVGSRQSVPVMLASSNGCGRQARFTMPRKVLQAYGYSGIILLAPSVECHCAAKK